MLKRHVCIWYACVCAYTCMHIQAYVHSLASTFVLIHPCICYLSSVYISIIRVSNCHEESLVHTDTSHFQPSVQLWIFFISMSVTLFSNPVGTWLLLALLCFLSGSLRRTGLIYRACHGSLPCTDHSLPARTPGWPSVQMPSPLTALSSHCRTPLPPKMGPSLLT